jgi:hypothetical protein
LLDPQAARFLEMHIFRNQFSVFPQCDTGFVDWLTNPITMHFASGKQMEAIPTYPIIDTCSLLFIRISLDSWSMVVTMVTKVSQCRCDLRLMIPINQHRICDAHIVT